jgi:hypothetical protein
MEDKDIEWTLEERAELAALLRQPVPPPELERRVIDRLAEAGLLASRRQRAIPQQWLLAAGLALLVVGFGFGRWQVRPSPTDGPLSRYLLLVHQDASFRNGPSPVGQVAEYARWARALARNGVPIEGDSLGSRHMLSPSGAESETMITAFGTGVGKDGFGLASDDIISGFFVFHAPNDERALAIARTCPHLAHGGRVEVRRIRPT